MASSLFALLDDIATILDDVAILTKVAAKKTAGVLGDDLALNAQQVTGVEASRELPVVWAVCKGSLINKLILVPSALAISFVMPWLVTPLLMIGGAYLCFEGFEKLAHKWMHSRAEDQAHEKELMDALLDPKVDLVALEKDKIKGAVRTDFILSAEIIAITLGTVQNSPLLTQFSVLAGIAIIMTVGVYGLVAGIVKMDDAGLHLSRRTGSGAWVALQHSTGAALLGIAPVLMKVLSVVGTAAMFLVGGGILVHGWPWLHHAVQALVAPWAAPDAVGMLAAVLSTLVPLLADAVTGVVAGAAVLAGVLIGQRLVRAAKALKTVKPH
jgi:predicted DNA repair protein MutK